MYKLLIADDEMLEREALRYFVNQSSLDIDQIIECSNGKEVVKQVFLSQPEIIILDINMPGLNGLEALEQIKNVKYPYRVIFSTAFDYFEYAVKALQLGAMDFLIKPVKREQLLSILVKAVDQLDREAEKAFREVKLQNVLDIMGQKILKKLITGDIDEEVLYYLEVLDVSYDTAGRCVCLRVVGSTGEEEKQRILKALKEELSYLDVTLLGDWRNSLVTLATFFASDCNEGVDRMVEERIKNVFAREGINFIFGEGTIFEDLSQAEQSFEDARERIGDMNYITKRPELDKNPDISVATKRIKVYIEENYDKHLTLDMIASESGYSKYYVNRMFKQQMDTTIMEYLIRIRINKAKELLSNDEYTVKQISTMVGYSEPNYFTLTFKKVEGVSPLKYRYQSREES